MADLFDYIKWRGDLTFLQSPFCEVDAMVLSALCYLPFERAGFKKGEKPTVSAAISKILEIPDFEKYLLLKSDIILTEKIPKSARFASLKILNFESITDEETETQFFAMTIELWKKQTIVVYRGTDNTIVGWKENFNMTFSPFVPAQKSALSYLEKVKTRIAGELILAGHSKGGNLAVYAAAFASERVQKKIKAIYSFDAPGFDEATLKLSGYRRICDRIKSFVPEASIVGMMLGHGEKYSVVHSTRGIDPLQHDIYSWEVMGAELVRLREVSPRSKFIDATLSDWLKNLTMEQRESLVSTVYRVLTESDAKTIKDLTENWFKTSKNLFVSIKNLDQETRKATLEVLKMLFESAKNAAFKKEEKDVKNEK